MNSKTAIVVTLITLGILITGLAILTNQPDTLLIIRIPAWLRAAGASTLFGLTIFWLRHDLWMWIAGPMHAAADWLADDDSGVR